VTYVETIAAVAMVGLAVVAASALTATHPTATDRLEAQRDMVRALDAVLEGVRGGAIPAADGWIANPIRTSARLQIRLSVERGRPDGLIRVVATARTTVRGRLLSRRLATSIWRPS
jgi:hypothetical protein